MRMTKQKECILNIIKNSYNHPTAEEIYNECRKEISNISLGTVYRNLNLMVNNHLIAKVHGDDGFEHFDGTIKKHHHFICSICHKIEDIYYDLNVNIKMDNCIVDDYIINFTGKCENCIRKEEKICKKIKK